MISRKDRKFSSLALLGKQRGGALILIAFMIGIMLTAFMIKNFSANSLKAEQDAKTMEALGQAKDGLISWAVSHIDVPGMLPYPDRSTDGNYDGYSDCPPAMNPFSYSNLIGQLPIYRQTNPCISPQTGIGGDWTDSQGNRLWYGVSRNLVREYQSPGRNPIINPGIINVDLLKPVPYEGTDATSPYPWLIIRDSTGSVISNRVAVVIIAPGPPLAGQNRTSTANATHFLDQVTIGPDTYSNWNYDEPAEDFIMGDTTTGTFNDRLIYITIDELMAALEQRAAAEARDVLRRYHAVAGRFPYAAPLGSVNFYSCAENNYNGLLPLSTSPMPGASCSCSSNRNCSCGFESIDSVTFSGGLNWQNTTGSCTRSGNSCTCTGAGECSAILNIFRFTCDASGNCISNILPGTFNFFGTFHKVNTDVNTVTGSCSRACGSTTVACTNAGTFSGGGCSDTGLAPTMRVTTNIGSSLLTTASNFSAQNVISGMSVIGPGIQDDTVVSTVDTATTLTMSRPATISSTTNITFTNRLPVWFIKNKWQDYIYYAASPTPTPGMTVGDRTGVEALLVTAGRPVNAAPFVESKGVAQTRLSCDITDYLDSTRNVTGNPYEATNKTRTLNYNDQLFIVSP